MSGSGAPRGAATSGTAYERTRGVLRAASARGGRPRAYAAAARAVWPGGAGAAGGDAATHAVAAAPGAGETLHALAAHDGVQVALIEVCESGADVTKVEVRSRRSSPSATKRILAQSPASR